MATAIVVFHQAGNRSLERNSMPVTRLPGARAEVITTGASSVQTTLDANGQQEFGSDGGFVTIFAIGANLWVTSGANPTAVKPATGANGAGYPILSGTSETFAIADNDKIALIEWA